MSVRSGDRVQYFRGLRLLVEVDQRHKEAEKLQPDASSNNFRKYFNNLLWLELKAHHGNRSVMEQDKWLVYQRQKSVEDVCQKVKDFKFTAMRSDVDANDIVDCDENHSCSCYLKKSVKQMSGSYLKNLFCGMRQVLKMQEEIEYVEALYCSMTGIVHDYEEFGNYSVQEKLKSLNCWFNTSSELMWTLLSMINLLGCTDNKSHIEGFLYDLELLDLSDEGFESLIPKSYLSVSELMFSCCKLTDSVLQMTEMQFHKRSVLNIHIQLVKNYFGCLVRSRNVIFQDSRQKGNVPSANSSNEFEAMIKGLSDISSLAKNIGDKHLEEVIEALIHSSSRKNCEHNVTADFAGLPNLEPLHVFLSNVMFAIMSQCLDARLEQSLSCKDKCSSSTSLLTVQQVVTECKEVIDCSILALSVHLYLMHSLHCVVPLRSFDISTIDSFRTNLMSLFRTYMEFVKLLVIGQLNGLPHAPRTFIDILNQEWSFAKRISLKLGLEDISTKKYIEMCTEVYNSTQTFLESAVNAIIYSKSKRVCGQGENKHAVSNSLNRCMSADSTLTPTSPHAGVLWFHRQRSESPHLAHMHSVFDDGLSPMDEYMAVQSPFSEEGNSWDPVESTRRYVFELGRAIQDMFHEARERFTRATHYATVLKHDLECAMAFNFLTDFSVRKSKQKSCANCRFLSTLEGYCCRVVFDESLKDSKLDWLASIFDMSQFHTFVRCDSETDHESDEFLHCTLMCLVSSTAVSNCLAKSTQNSDTLLVLKKFHNPETIKNTRKRHQCCWHGREVNLSLHDINGVDVVTQPEKAVVNFDHDLTVICFNGANLALRRSEICKLLSKYMKLSLIQTSVHQQTQSLFAMLHQSILMFCETLVEQVYNMSKHLQEQVVCQLCTEGHEAETLTSEISQITQRIFNIGFECLQSNFKLMSGPIRHDMNKLQTLFVCKWMTYILEHVPRGNGKKPRWAAKGLKFLINLNADYIKGIPEEDYKNLKGLINRFFDHLIGTKKRVGPHRLETPCNSKVVYRSLSNHSSKGSASDDEEDEQAIMSTQTSIPHQSKYLEEVRNAVLDLEYAIDKGRYDSGVIGRVLDASEYTPVVQLHVRSASFRWQRGKKIGEGTFGKVYTCVNMDTGKILAMKEIQFQAHDERKVKEILDEMANFEGIVHKNLVRYFGVEIHRDLMFIFMEYCDSGTLADISQIGLPEVMIQEYTSQLVMAVDVLHHQGIVHRDIKGSNIFLMSNGMIKVGDFGSAIRLSDRSKTSPGEIVSRTGITTAYTAPEVINSTSGYGRAADVWSIGCVVIEMASGKRPWHDHEPFQIMYKVGMGHKPPIPSTLSHDGQGFVGHCLEVDTSVRWSVAALQSHPFVKVALPIQD